ncbi:MAG: ABC transporter substrate-binding protein [Proteobacteria bacterium]|nr:ABC transporter substrate-binding protein [Pseudomonadota bacterium]
MSVLKRFLLGAAALAALLGLAALVGSRPVQAREPVTISFWHAMRGEKEAALRDLIAEFEKSNPSIRVQPRFVGSSNPQWGNDYNSLYRGILESLAGHAPPDAAQVYENWTTQLIDYGYLVPVQDYFSSADAFTTADINDLVPVFRSANTHGSKLWTLPFNKSIYVLYYNEGLLRAAGAGVPRTWEDVRAVAQKVVSAERGIYGITVQPNVDTLGHYLYAHGGDFVNDNQAIFNNPLGLSSLRFWVDLVNVDRTAFPTFDPAASFSQGKSAMYIFTTSAYSHLRQSSKFPVRLAAMPSAHGRAPRMQLAGTNLALFKTTAERQTAAWKFIRFLTSRSVNTRWALRTGYLPVRQSAIQSAEYQAFLTRNPDYRDAAVANLRNACVQPKVSAWESIRGIIDDAMFEAISRRSSPQDALDRAVAISNDLIRKILGAGGVQR